MREAGGEEAREDGETAEGSGAPIRIRIGLRGRLLIGTLPFLSLTFAAIWMVASETARSGLVSLSDANLKVTSESLSDAVRGILSDSRADALAAARMDMAAQAIEEGDPKNFAWFADELLATKHRYSALLVTDAKGTVVAANTRRRDGATAERSLIGASLADQDFQQKVVQAEVGTVITIAPTRLKTLAPMLRANEGVVGFSLPVFDVMGDVIGSLGLFCSLDFLAERLSRHLVDDSGTVDALAMLVDREGKPVVLPPGLKNANQWFASQVEATLENQDSWEGPGGTHYHLSQAVVPGVGEAWGWRLVTMTRVATLEAPVAAITDRLRVTFAGAFLLAAVMLIAVASRFVKPLRRLSSATAHTERATDYKSLPVHTRDEVGMLTQSYNRMMGTIREYEGELEKKVLDRTQALNQKTHDIQNMLQNMRLGVFTVLEDHSIHHEYSRHLEQIFEDENLAGRSALSLLFDHANVGSDRMDLVRVTLSCVIGQDVMFYEMNEHGLLTEFEIELNSQRKILELDWNPITDDEDTVEKMLVNVRDVTALRALEREASQQRKQLEMVGQILAISTRKLSEFTETSRNLMDEAESLLEQAEVMDKERITVLFRNMHTIKGTARTLGLAYLLDAAHEAEESYDRMRHDPDVDIPRDTLLHQLNDVRQGCEEYDRVCTELTEGLDGGSGGGSEQLGELIEQAVQGMDAADPDSIERTRTFLMDGLAMTRSQNLEQALRDVVRSTSTLAAELHKFDPHVHLTGGALRVPDRCAGVLQDVMTHLLRNCVDHGIEVPAVRREKGKPEMGTIQIEAIMDGDVLQIALRDDGAGLNLTALEKRGRENGTLDEEETSDAEVAELIFASGVSTASSVGAISGRGVGMDAVRAFLRDRGGDAWVDLLEEQRQSSGHRPARFMVRLPLQTDTGAAEARQAS